MGLETILSRITGGETVSSSELLPYLCLERREQRAKVNMLLARAYWHSGWQSGGKEHLQYAKVFIQRAWLLSKFSTEWLQLFVEIHSALDDIPAIRAAYKRVGMAMAKQGNVSEALRYFDLWQYAYPTLKNVDKQEYDFDILECVDRLAQPYRVLMQPAGGLIEGRKIRLAYLLKGILETGSVLVKINLVLAKFHDRSLFEPMFFVPESQSAIQRSASAREFLRLFESYDYKVVTAPDSGTTTERLLGIANKIKEANADVLITGAALGNFEHYFITALRPAPLIVGLVQGPPEQFAPPALDWGVAWSLHPLMDSPVDCLRVCMELDLPERSRVKAPEKRELDIPEEAIVIVSAGRYVKFQEPHFWKAIIELLDNHPQVYFLAIGTEQAQISFLSAMLSPEVRSRIRFQAWGTDEYLRSLCLGDIFIDTFPSSGGTVLTDAMALGIPPVVFRNNYMRLYDQTDWSPAEELVNETELIVPRGDFDSLKQVVTKLIGDKDLRRNLGKSVEEYIHRTKGNPRRAVQQCEAAYKRVVEERPSGIPSSTARGVEVEKLASPPKLAVLSHILPPSPSGQATMLHRLFRTVPAGNYCLISREDYSRGNFADDKGRLTAPYYHLPPETKFGRPNRFGLYRVRDLGNILSEVYRRARGVAQVVKLEKCGAIMACSGDVIDIPAGYLASRWARVPFYAYLFDDYLYQWTRPLYRWFVKFAEPIALKRAATVIVPNEFLRDEYRRRYGLEATVIHNPVEIEEANEEVVAVPIDDNHEIRIVYTGAIYRAHFDAFRNLVTAIGQLDQLNVRLHLYTAQPREELDRENICGPIVYHDHVPPAVARSVQRQADILFLPLAFVSEIPEVIKTSAPGKMGEYMASGRPILAHAPSWSFVSWYFRQYDCGMVVDESDPAALAVAIKQILDDEVMRGTMTENSRVRATVDFSLVEAQTRFLKLFSSERDGV